VGGRWLYFGGSAYTPPDRPLPEANLEIATAAARLETVDNPDQSRGVIAVDLAHNNALFLEELNILFSKIVARGFSYEVIFDPDDVDFDLEGQGLADKLRYAQALILPLPRMEYTAEEINQIEQFVGKGGRLLLIGDPTRTVSVEALNSIAGSFEIIYLNDYLYNLNAERNDNNYRNVVYTNFTDSPLTAGLDESSKVIFYSGGSISAPGNEIILGDDTTYSSISEGGRSVAAAALTTDDQVLALGDLTFLSEPYSAAENNGAFINNMADFLTGGVRQFELKDFPYFLNPQVDIVFDNPLVLNSQYDDTVQLKTALEQLERQVTLTDEINPDHDIIFVSRFDETDRIQDYLDEAGITIFGPNEGEEEPPADDEAEEQPAFVSDALPDVEERFIDGRIQISGLGDLERGGATLFSLHEADDRNILLILSDTPDTNADAFELLLSGELSDCVAGPTVAVCHTQEPGGELPPSLRRSRIDNILVVGDDNGRPREDAKTSYLDYNNVLSDTFRVDVWSVTDKGNLDLDRLLEYDAVIWSTGDYWDDSIEEEDALMLARYIRLGGNLILSGASIGFDWDHTDFMTQVAHADYLDFAEQQDISLVLSDHPLAKNFDEDTVIPFVDITYEEEVLQPDVVRHTSDARVIFERGPDSQQAGAAAIIAYEDDRSKIAYFAFPVYLLPPEAKEQLIFNAVDWFSKKPLDLPDEDDYEPYELQDEPAEEEEVPAEGEEPPANGNGETAPPPENGE